MDRYEKARKKSLESKSKELDGSKENKKTQIVAEQTHPNGGWPICGATYNRLILMAVIKGKEKKLNKPLSPAKAKLSEKAKKKLRDPRAVQPIPTVAVS